MANITPISGAARSNTVNTPDRANGRRDLAASAQGVSETVNGERNANATANEARRLAGTPAQSGVGGAVDIRG
jgi:hypothetical protein